MFLILAESKRDKIMSKNSLTLAITTIGALLGAGKITRDQEGKPIEEVGLKIPDYQRPYKWKAENANQLLDDILGAQTDNKEVYRVGTLILHKTTCEEQEVYHIVDGQQRVITFSLLLKAFGCDVKFLQEEIPANSLYVQNILNNYALFCRRVAKYSSEEKNRLLTYIQSNCELIVVITEDITEAFQFFDSQNARGKKLYPHDLLKAYHLREMRSVNADETEKIVKTWEDMNQRELSSLFKDYLYRIKAWIKGNRADELDEKNIIMFKGLNREDNYPYAQFYKGAFGNRKAVDNFDNIYGDGTALSKGIPLFVFNYLDYKLWREYLSVKGSKEGAADRQKLFDKFGCSDFGLEIFKQFYFSRTRRSLEHFFPQADINKLPVNLTESQINCFGNYGMIGADANSSGSNYAPKVKLDHYLDTLSGKIKLVAVASLKFMIMLQACKDNIGKRESCAEWNWDDIVTHQKKMKEFLK